MVKVAIAEEPVQRLYSPTTLVVNCTDSADERYSVASTLTLDAQLPHAHSTGRIVTRSSRSEAM
jgi:hypothetical protein